MDKRELFCLFMATFISIGFSAKAQSSSGAYQRIELHIQPSIEIASLKASEVQLTVKQDKLGKSAASGTEFRIRSNKNFVVKVSTYQQPEINKGAPAKNNLQLAVAGNAGEGSVEGYTPISDSPKDIISKGRRGEQIFAVNYQVKRTGKAQQETRPVGVVYTATEP